MASTTRPRWSLAASFWCASVLLLASAAPPSLAETFVIGVQNTSTGMEVVAAGSTPGLYRKNIMGRYVSQACEPPRCQNSLVVMESSAESTSRVLLVPAEGGVVLVKLLLSAMNDLVFEEDTFVPLLQGSCSPVYIHDKLISDVIYVLCVQQAHIILVEVTVDMENLNQSSSSGAGIIQHQATLDCLSNIERSPPTQLTQPLLVFSLCGQIVTLTLGVNTFTEFDEEICPNVVQITSPRGHPGTLLVRCSNYTLYYDLDNEEIINQTTPQDPATPTPCTNPLVSVTVFPAAGDIEYRLWTTSCSRQLKIASSELLSWQCLGDQDQLLFAFTTHQGLFATQISLAGSSCAQNPTNRTLASTTCSTTSCRPLSSLKDQYLNFQVSSGQTDDYQVSVFSVGSSIVKIAEIRHVDFRLITILNYSLPTTPYPTLTSTSTTTTTTTPDITPTTSVTERLLSPGGLAAAIVAPLAVLAVIVIAGGIVMIRRIYNWSSTNKPTQESAELTLDPLPSESNSPEAESVHHHVHDSPTQCPSNEQQPTGNYSRPVQESQQYDNPMTPSMISEVRPSVAEHLCGVHVVDEKLFPVSGEGPQLLEWKEYGFKMQVPKGATSGPCDIAVKAIVAGQFEFPEGTELVSAIFAISTSRRLHKSVTLEIQHCVAIRMEQQSQYLGFARAKCTQPNLPYQFKLLEDGVFSPDNEYGRISCDGFSLIGIVKKKISSVLLYLFPKKKYIAQVCYESKGERRNYWNVKFAVTQDLNALKEHVDKQHWERGTCLPFMFNSESLELMLTREDLHKGWSIQPQRYPCKIYQKDVDKWSSAEPISCDVTLAAQEGPSTAQFLHYPVKIGGIDPEGQTIFIQRCLCSSEPRRDQETTAIPPQDALPSLPHILSFPIPSGPANIAQKIAQSYEQFGILLLDDADGSAVRSLASMPNKTPDNITLAILQKWIQGEGRKPTSWETLITVIQEIGLDTLARDIRAGLPNLLG